MAQGITFYQYIFIMKYNIHKIKEQHLLTLINPNHDKNIKMSKK